MVEAKDAWIADRNFCTTDFLFGIHVRKASFIIRQHAQNLTWKRVGRERARGRCDTGKLYEQMVELSGADGQRLRVRRITLKLDKPTRDGDWEIHILTNLPERVANAKRIAALYQKRWKVEI